MGLPMEVNQRTDLTQTVQWQAEAGQDIQRLLDLPPNPNLPAVNLSIVPGELVSHDSGTVVMAINFGHPDIDGYGDGIREAIGRGEKVVLILEQPPKDKPQTPEQWRAYVRQIRLLYQPRILIDGNECNAPTNHPQSVEPDEYLQMYRTVWEEIKKVNPDTRIYLYGEAYDGSGEYLEKILDLIKINGLNFDGLAIHYYDTSTQLISRVEMYRKILKKAGFEGKPIIISEMGNPDKSITSSQRNSEMVKMLAISSWLVDQGLVDGSYWYAAASFDPRANEIQALFRFSDSQVGKLEPTSAVMPWRIVTRLLRHGIRLTQGRGVTVIRGYDANDNQGQVVWSNDQHFKLYQVPRGKAAYGLNGNRLQMDIEGWLPLPTNAPIFVY